MRELVVDIRRLVRHGAPELSTGPTASLVARRRSAWALVGAALSVGLSLMTGLWRLGGRAATVQNPLENALFTRFTNFEGAERSAAISPDGRFVAFRADRDGPFDVWLGQVGAGRFVNLTKGIDDEFSIDTPSVGFS